MSTIKTKRHDNACRRNKNSRDVSEQACDAAMTYETTRTIAREQDALRTHSSPCRYQRVRRRAVVRFPRPT